MELCVVENAARRGGRWLEVAPERFPRWIASFERRHGASASPAASPGSSLTVAVTGEGVTFTAPDGATAKCRPPFWESRAVLRADAGAPPPAAGEAADAIAGHALAGRVVGVLLVRLGGYAAGVFTGSPPSELAVHKTGSRLVHGRSAAGGWSQHRFARRREKQVREAVAAAASAAAEVFGRWGQAAAGSGEGGAAGGPARAEDGSARGTQGTGLDVVVLGGDKRAVADVSGDPRLAPYLTLATDRFLTVPDPRLAVLRDAPRLFLAVRIFLTEPAA
jgi:VLRF1 release factor-like protein